MVMKLRILVLNNRITNLLGLIVSVVMPVFVDFIPS